MGGAHVELAAQERLLLRGEGELLPVPVVGALREECAQPDLSGAEHETVALGRQGDLDELVDGFRAPVLRLKTTLLSERSVASLNSAISPFSFEGME